MVEILFNIFRTRVSHCYVRDYFYIERRVNHTHGIGNKKRYNFQFFFSFNSFAKETK